MNLDSQTRTFRIRLAGESDSASMSVDVPPLTMRQFPAPAVIYGSMSVMFEAAGDFAWTAYASTTNNVSGENTLAPAR